MKHTIESLGRQFAENTLGGGGPVAALIHGQITALEKKLASNQKPYFNLELSDGAGVMKVKVWNNSPAFPQCTTAETKMKPDGSGARKPLFVALDGMFKNGEYGFESNDFRIRALNDDEIETLINGTPEQRVKVDSAWAKLMDLIGSMEDATYQELCRRVAGALGKQFCRAAGARGRHHARRGGLVEHTSQMMLSCHALCRVYPHLNRSLILAGAFLHDLGKIIENQYEERGFAMPFSARAELYGHIAIGVEYVRAFGRELVENDAAALLKIDCLCHLVLSHHGQVEYGSPVEPKLPEAAVLHYVDQIDAKLEMMRAAYEAAGYKKPGEVVERQWPMSINLVVTPKEWAGEQEADGEMANTGVQADG
jgi:3'-5' exoribonuclease